MDKIRVFRYAYGGIEDLRRGEFDSMQVADSLSAIRYDSSKKIVVVPRFIGVYQQEELKSDSLQEKDEEEENKKVTERVRELLESLSKMALESDGIEERFHPDLMHLGYDGKLYNERIVREIFGSGLERIAVSSIEELPDFGAKSNEDYEFYCKIKELPYEADEMKRADTIRKIASESYDVVTAQLREFGLTREEYAFLNILKRLKDIQKEKKIIDCPDCLRFFTGILGKLP